MQLLRIKFLESVATPRQGYTPGKEYDMPIDEAMPFIKCGLAIKISGDIPIVDKIFKAAILDKEIRPKAKHNV